MIARGAYGFLHKALERYVPVDRIVLLNVDPVCERWGSYAGAPGECVIEVKYSREDDAYLAFNANNVVRDALEHGDRYIRAFVEPDAGEIGSRALTRFPGSEMV